MKLKKAIDKLFSQNEYLVLWVETDQQYIVRLWMDIAWRLPKEFANLRIHRFFGTIPQSIVKADTINILIKHEPITVGCHTCKKRKTMECPNTAECDVFVRKPHWEWDEKL